MILEIDIFLLIFVWSQTWLSGEYQMLCAIFQPVARLLNELLQVTSNQKFCSTLTPVGVCWMESTAQFLKFSTSVIYQGRGWFGHNFHVILCGFVFACSLFKLAPSMHVLLKRKSLIFPFRRMPDCSLERMILLSAFSQKWKTFLRISTQVRY